MRKVGETRNTKEDVMAPAPASGYRPKARKRSHRVALIDLDVARKVEMTLAEWMVVLTIARYIPERSGHEARVTLREVAAVVQMKPSNVSRIVKNLVDRDILIRGDYQGSWGVNPHILYNGEFAEWNRVIEDYMVPRFRRPSR